jgi:DNA-binding MarR family transcriptional regulator
MNTFMSKEIDSYQILFEEVRRLHNRLRYVGDRLHEFDEVSTATRSLLLSIQREGPSTVPDLAKERLVSRQIIQTQINVLLDQGLVTPQENPKHRRSKLMALTPKGKTLVQQMLQREAALLKKGGAPLAEEEVRQTSASLHTLRNHLEALEPLL